MADLYAYQDYREYLKAYYEEQKAAVPSFSYRTFARKAGINASAFLYYVIKGKRNLTKASILKVSKAIGHTPDEAEYFENLVFFNQAKTIAEKTVFYARLVEKRRPLDIRNIGTHEYEYYATWYHSVVREVVTFLAFGEDYRKLGSFLVPPITEHQARQSVELLVKLGLIERAENGLYRQTSKLIGTQARGIAAFTIEKFQLEMLSMAMQAYDRWPRADRMSSSTTFSVSRETFELFRMKARDFRRELLEIAKLDSKPEQVFQLTMNLFPLSKRCSRGEPCEETSR